MGSILISRVCSPMIINNDCRCVTWMFMNAILMKRHRGEGRRDDGRVRQRGDTWGGG